ncbi:hypothetical protein Strvi_3743 [Streptomyces violaceusniger Tu 4113]|uniref:Uncharacterized protein n=1 Tax=Streptomyces violaceusniger (strain Tu 4113) TaxID=653045 RepID=G2NZD8_STRV4|nr:hypothetical protein Strvi_3743 [Streptomyces violaceusniger Tu 4113]
MTPCPTTRPSTIADDSTTPDGGALRIRTADQRSD